MKKIILVMLLLSFIVISSAMSKKNKTLPQKKQPQKNLQNKEIYMPKKLIYSELPDDYPKELDELFKFYYNVLLDYNGMLEHDKGLKKIDALKKIIKKHIDNNSEEELLKYTYLRWLA